MQWVNHTRSDNIVKVNMSKDEFLLVLNTEFNGKTSNRKLLAALGWEREFFLTVRAGLIADGLVKAGRGRGGTVRVV